MYNPLTESFAHAEEPKLGEVYFRQPTVSNSGSSVTQLGDAVQATFAIEQPFAVLLHKRKILSIKFICLPHKSNASIFSTLFVYEHLLEMNSYMTRALILSFISSGVAAITLFGMVL